MKSKKNWDEIYRKNKEHFIENKPSKYLEFLITLLKKEDKILEIGCGNGINFIKLKNLGYNIIGIDISKEAIASIKENNVFVCDAEKLNFKDNCFDVVYSFNTLHFTDINKSFSEIYKVLKTSGMGYFVIILQTKKKNNITSINKPHLDHFEIINEKTFEITEEVGTENEHSHIIWEVLIRKKNQVACFL